ncbi:Wzz/FepE/Etk N-terminal domain-containing protein [Legionella gresilensis]|uniref:Wzz/FepE/Etk N-terminal domain-containing protein n=1 Tax=Legionella gresilensis TaxID=91823 RepID=UPI00104199CB|nr:Wzz/FepE/Etk N-terminal domain-containing protein [Legionella gresilensis]
MNKNEKHKALTYNSEPTLLDHLAFLWYKKWIISSITFLSLFTAILYIFYTKPIYQVQTVILPLTLTEIEQLNYQRAQGEDIRTLGKQVAIPSFTIEEIYGTFTKDLIAESTKINFLKSNVGQQCKPPNANLTIRETPQPNSVKYSVTVKSYNSEQAKQCTINYLTFVKSKATQKILKLVNMQNKKLLRHLLNEIKITKRALAVDKRYNDETLKSVKITDTVKLALNQDKAIKSDEIIAASSTYKELNLVYLKQGLSKQQASVDQQARAVLKNMRRDMLELKLFNKQAKYQLYKNITKDSEKISPIFFHLDKPIEIPNSPIWPKKTFILIVSVFLGLILGLFTAVLHKFITKT